MHIFCSVDVTASSLAHLPFDMLQHRSRSFQLAECKSSSELTTPIHSKWVIDASRITIDCKPDGSRWNLGAGEFSCSASCLLSCLRSDHHSHLHFCLQHYSLVSCWIISRLSF